MGQAILAVTALILPWLAGYILAGLAIGPACLRAARTRHGLRIHPVSDDALAIAAWPGIAAHLLLAEMRLRR